MQYFYGKKMPFSCPQPQKIRLEYRRHFADVAKAFHNRFANLPKYYILKISHLYYLHFFMFIQST